MIKVKIKDFEYEIKFITEAKIEDIEVFTDTDETRYLGLCDMCEQIIYIVHDIQKDVRLKETIRHELSHAYFDSYCLKDKDDEYTEEFICDFVAAYSVEINRLTEDIYRQYTYMQLNAITKELEALEGDIDGIHE